MIRSEVVERLNGRLHGIGYLNEIVSSSAKCLKDFLAFPVRLTKSLRRLLVRKSIPFQRSSELANRYFHLRDRGYSRVRLSPRPRIRIW
jgi:hypothetical protein